MTGNSESLWRLRQSVLRFESRALLMGIVNVTPDSFSDGGKWFDAKHAIEHGMRLAEEGAAILDIGGESTRPYSEPVSPAEQIRRVVPVIENLRGRINIPISIDTSNAEVAAAAIAAGAEAINDVTGLDGDPEMLELAARTQVGVCAMHMQGTPQTMQDQPQYNNCVEEIAAYLQSRYEMLVAGGIAKERICLDPGIGFGKTHEHNWELIRNAKRFLSLPAPILVGHSRKGFVAQAIGNKERNRDAGTLGISLYLAEQGIHLLRVHEIRSTLDAFTTFRLAKYSR